MKRFVSARFGNFYRTAIFFICFLIFTNLHGKTYSITTITVDDGLPQSTISVIMQDYRGFLWIGTHGGIVRYDGKKIKPYTSNEGYSFFLNKGIIEKEPGVIWVADASEGLWELKNDIARQIIFDKNFTDATINFIYKGNDGRILVGAEPGGLYIFYNESVTRIGSENGLVSEQVISGAIDSDGNIWVGTFQNGAQKIINGIPGRNLTVDDGLPGNYIRYILPNSNGEVWFGTKKGLYILSDEGYQTLLDAPGEDRFIFHILKEDEKNMWVSTANNGGGLIHIEDKKVTEIMNSETGLLSYKATWAYIDEYGTIFVGTANGLARISHRPFVNYSRTDGFIEPYITGVCQTSDGEIWVGTQTNGIYKFRDEMFVPVLPPELNKYERIKHLLAVDNQVWVGSSKGLIVLTDGPPVHGVVVDSLKDKLVRRITRYDDAFYITAYQSLWKIQAGTIHEITYNLKEDKFSFWGLEVDKDGRLWLATNGQGLWQLENETWTKVTRPFSSFPENFFGITKDRERNLYFPSFMGAYKWNGEKFSIEFPAEHTVWDILPTKDMGIWYGTSRGLFQRKDGQLTLFNMKSGLLSSEFNISSFLEDQEGNLWFGGVAALVKYRKMKEVPKQISPKTFILSLTSSGRSYTNFNRLVFEPDQNNITLKYCGIDLGNPESVRFRYKLEGLGSNWSPEVEQTFVSYPHLDHGKYRFLVESRGTSGIWDENRASVYFEILSPWWKTWWAQIFYVAMVVLSGWYFVKWQVGIVKKRSLLLEKKIEERTFDLTQANLQLNQEIKERKQAVKKLKERMEELETFRKVTVDRELVMIELKEKIKKLEKKPAEKGND